MAMFVDRLPLPSKLPLLLVSHWFKGNATFVLCSKVHGPLAVPLVATIRSEVPLKLIPVICGDEGGAVPTMICPEPVVNTEPICCVHEAGKLAGYALFKTANE